MPAATADIPRSYDGSFPPTFEEFPAQASVKAFSGTAITTDANGRAGPLATTEEFVGFAEGQVDNSAGAAGAKRIKVRQRGAVELDVATADATSVNDNVYASDDATFTLVSTSNKLIGKVKKHISGTRCLVYFEAESLQSV